MKVVKPFGKGASSNGLRISLCDTNPEMTDAWLGAFYGVDGVEIVLGDLMEADADAVVSPANSFGDMSGGVDKRIDDYCKGAAQELITTRIREDFLGELPVGMAVVVAMPNARPSFVIAAPTMRVPEEVANTLNAYLAMRAVLAVVDRHNSRTDRGIRTVAVPGLCTGVGRMAHSVSAHQMRAAYDNVVGGGWKDVVHPAMAPFGLGRKSITWRSAP